MKHVFIVHSQITKLMSLAIIGDLCLSPNDVIIFTYREMNLLEGYRCEAFPFSHFPEQESFPLFRRFWKGWGKLGEIDDFISEICQDNNFLFYTPHLYPRMLELVASHSKCSGYCFVEEGTLSLHPFPANIRSKIYKRSEKLKIFLNYGKRLAGEKTFFKKDYLTAYKFSDHAFPSFPRVKKVEIVLRHQEFVGQEILVLDPVVEANMISIDDYLLAISKLIDLLQINETKTIYYKFHPSQLKDKSKARIEALFTGIRNTSFLNLAGNVSLEEIANSNSQVNFYSITSSLLYYGRYLGAKTYSFANLLPDKIEVENFFNKQPKAFRDSLVYI